MKILRGRNSLRSGLSVFAKVVKNMVVQNSKSIHFTWQPLGSQFTFHTEIPVHAVRFTIRRPHMIDEAAISPP